MRRIQWHMQLPTNAASALARGLRAGVEIEWGWSLGVLGEVDAGMVPFMVRRVKRSRAAIPADGRELGNQPL